MKTKLFLAFSTLTIATTHMTGCASATQPLSPDGSNTVVDSTIDVPSTELDASDVQPGIDGSTDARPTDGLLIDLIFSDPIPRPDTLLDTQLDTVEDGIDTDVLPLSLAGEWHAIQWEPSSPNSPIQSLTNNNQQVTIGQLRVNARVNGWLDIHEDRLAMTFGVLMNDHFFARDVESAPLDALSTFGAIIPGTLSGNTFLVPGGNDLVFTEGPNGTIISTDDNSGDRITWARTMPLTLGPTYNNVGQAVLAFSTVPPQRAVAPRFTLLWDLSGNQVLPTNGTPIALGALRTARYTINVPSVPQEAWIAFGRASVAIAYGIIFDDADQNGMYSLTSSSDTIRGISPVALVYVRGNSPELDVSPFRGFVDGFTLARLSPDFGIQSMGLTRFDSTVPVAVDIAIEPGPSAEVIPNIIP